MPMIDTHNRDSGYNGDLRTEVEALSRKFNELEMVLRNYLEEANDEKIKSNRRLQDTLYNLDDDNVPGLTIIRKKTFKNGESIAALNLFADETKAEIKAIAEFQKDTTDSIAKITQTATEQGAKIETLTSWSNGIDSSLSSITAQANENGAKISLLVTRNENGELVTDGIELISAINEATTTLKIKADVLDIDVSDKVTIGDSIVIDPGGSFSISDTFGDDGTRLRTFWDSKGIRFDMYGPDSADQWGATYEADVIFMSGNQHETTITSEEISTDRVAVNYLNGYKISFDENGYLKGVIE